jgi:hypothetical protein
MATIFDLIEVTNISPDTTYSALQGNYLGVVDGMVSAELDDGEFDEGDIVTIGGVKYAITLIQEPTSSGRFTTTDGTNLSFNPQSESNLDAVFLTLSNGVETRYFIVPNDSYGDMTLSEIRTGSLNDVAGNDAAIISTTDHSVSVVCFANGTLIEGADGRHFPIEALKAGDKVRTLDHGLQPITWTGFRSIGVAQLMGLPHLRPVRICQGALGQGTPKLDLFVSQQHRVLVRSRIAERMFGNREVLVAAKKLIGLDGIAVSQSFAPLSYHHLMFDRHEIIFANGALCESLYPGPQAIRTLNEIVQTAGNSVAGIADGAQTFRPARLFATGPKAEKLARRHKKNDRTICGTSMPRAVPKPGTRG